MNGWNEVRGDYSKQDGKIKVIIFSYVNGSYRVSLSTAKNPEIYLALPEDFKTDYREIRSLETAMHLGDKMIIDIKAIIF